MNPRLKRLLHSNFRAFHARAFSTLHPGNELQGDYLDYLCEKVAKFADGDISRLLANLPPRHLKTFTTSVCGSAWLLAHNPGIKILLVTGSDGLSDQIAHEIKKILTTQWFKQVFKTRIAKDRRATRRFATNQGGSVRAVSILGNFTGFGGDVVIIDDPHQIKDARDINSIERVIEIFDTQVMSRLNRQNKGRMMVIAHRVHERDLSGHLLEEGAWQHVALPLIAPKDRKITSSWRRAAGAQLIPGMYSDKEIASMRARKGLPDFETLQQQNPSHGLPRITAEYFQLYPHAPDISTLPAVLSIDPGQVGGRTHSFNVAQIWVKDSHRYWLIDQCRAQSRYGEFRHACQRLIRKYRPSAVIIEMTGHGPALAWDLKLHPSTQLERVHPVTSKAERLAEHIEKICGRQISLAEGAEWLDDYIDEFVQFPSGPFTDQIDATTQYLDFMDENPTLSTLPARALHQFAAARHFQSASFGNLRSASDAGNGSPRTAAFAGAFASRWYY